MRFSVRGLFILVAVVAVALGLVLLLPEWLGTTQGLYFDGTDAIAIYHLPSTLPKNPIKTVRMDLDGKVKSRNRLPDTHGFRNFPPRYSVESRYDAERYAAVPNSDGQVSLRLCNSDYVKIGSPFLVPHGDYWLLNDKRSLLVVQGDRIQLRQVSAKDGTALLMDEQKRSPIVSQQPTRLGIVFEVDPTRFVLCSYVDRASPVPIWDPRLVELYACDSGKLRLISAWKAYSSFQNFQLAIDDGDIIFTNAAGTHLNRVNAQDGSLTSSLELPITIAGGGFDYSPYCFSDCGFIGVDYDEVTGEHAYSPKTLTEIPLSPDSIESDSKLELMYWDESRSVAWYYNDSLLFGYQPATDQVIARITIGYRLAQYSPEIHRLDGNRILVLSDNRLRWLVVDLEKLQLEKSVKLD